MQCGRVCWDRGGHLDLLVAVLEVPRLHAQQLRLALSELARHVVAVAQVFNPTTKCVRGTAFSLHGAVAPVPLASKRSSTRYDHHKLTAHTAPSCIRGLRSHCCRLMVD